MILVDTWAWVALADRRDPYHRKAKAQHKKLRRAPLRHHGLRRGRNDHLPVPRHRTRAGPKLHRCHSSADSGQYDLVHLSQPQFRRAWDLRQKYHDKPGISFVDFTSMVVMLDLGITEVFTGDDNFRQVNLGFQLVP
jgi:predicted nucleic acid-binding protein